MDKVYAPPEAENTKLPYRTVLYTEKAAREPVATGWGKRRLKVAVRQRHEDSVRRADSVCRPSLRVVSGV